VSIRLPAPATHGVRLKNGERGQALILGILAITVSFIIGVIAIDFGLWLSERRGSQTDADFIALAGAWELLDPAGTAGDATAAANDAMAANNEQDNLTLENLIVDNSCFDQDEDDAVIADVRHGSRSLFGSIFGLVAPNIGAHAKACAGATNGPRNIVPFEIDNNTSNCFGPGEVPLFTITCGLEFGAQSGNPRGLLDLDAPGDFCSDASGSGDIIATIEFGAEGICDINPGNSCSPVRNGPWYQCVAVQTGNPQKVQDGIRARIAREGACDIDMNGVEEFYEVVELITVIPGGGPFDDIYEARDCDTSTSGDQISPRLITIIVLDNPPGPSNKGHPIEAFATQYVVGCQSDKSKVPVLDPLLADKECSFAGSGPPGHVVVWGQFVKLIVEGSGTGPPGPSTTSFSISLVE